MNRSICILRNSLFLGGVILGLTNCNSDTTLPTDEVKGDFIENFDGLGLGFSSWQLINDQNQINSHYRGVYDEAWAIGDFGLYNENNDNRMVISCGWLEGQATGTMDRWLISPLFEVKGEDPHLYWEECTPDPRSQQTYRLMISPSGGTSKTDFTETAYKIPAGKTGALMNQMLEISLKKFVGQKIRIAFVNDAINDNDNAGFLVAIDNIFLSPKLLPAVGSNLVQNSYALTQAGATFMSTPENTQTTFDIELLPAGQTPQGHSGLSFQSASTQVQFTGLKPGTRYHAYIRPQGGNAWIGPYPIQTARELPYQMSFDGNLLFEGALTNDMNQVDNSPINSGTALVGQTLLDDTSIMKAGTPPLELSSSRQIKVSFDYYVEEPEGILNLWMRDCNSTDFSSMVSTHDIIDNPDLAGKINHFEEILEPVNTDGSYQIIVNYSYHQGEKVFKFFLDNLKIEYVD